MDMAEAGEKAGLSEKRAADDEFRRVLESATNSILNAEAFRQPYPLIRFRDFFPSRLLRPPACSASPTSTVSPD